MSEQSKVTGGKVKALPTLDEKNEWLGIAAEILQSPIPAYANAGRAIRRLFAALERVEAERDVKDRNFQGAAAMGRALKEELDKAVKFKTFVHTYLDQHGVPHGDPENQHQKEGCRIGARLDLMFAERDALREENARLVSGLAIACEEVRQLKVMLEEQM